MATTDDGLLTLASGPLALKIAPRIGGAIVGLRHGDFDLMRPTPPAAIQRGLVRQTACYPLVPYSNRIAHGRFTFGGETHQLTLNFGDHPHSIHGNAWQNRWRVAESAGDRALLSLDHEPFGFGPAGWDGWPYRYGVTQSFALDPGGVTVTLVLTNRDHRPMPAGLGWHPFFPLRPDTEFAFSAESVWMPGPDALPAALEPIPERWDFSTMRAVGEPGLDHVFVGWNGIVRIRYPSDRLGVTLSADPLFSHLVAYVPTGRGFFAVEPVSHMTDAVNRATLPGNGLRTLEPGEQLVGSMRIAAEAFP